MIYYVMTTGSYSDYHILGVTTDKKLAHEVKEFYDKHPRYEGDGVTIEEYEDLANKFVVPDIYKCCFRIRKVKRGGQLYCNKKNDIDYNLIGEVYETTTVIAGRRHKALCVELFADTEEKALKIATDKFTQYEAEKKGLC